MHKIELFWIKLGQNNSVIFFNFLICDSRFISEIEERCNIFVSAGKIIVNFSKAQNYFTCSFPKYASDFFTSLCNKQNEAQIIEQKNAADHLQNMLLLIIT